MALLRVRRVHEVATVAGFRRFRGDGAGPGLAGDGIGSWLRVEFAWAGRDRFLADRFFDGAAASSVTTKVVGGVEPQDLGEREEKAEWVSCTGVPVYGQPEWVRRVPSCFGAQKVWQVGHMPRSKVSKMAV